MLVDPEAGERIYRPEGAEDLAIYSTEQQLIEVVQVKDHSSPLTLSALNPSSREGYFARLQQRRMDHPACLNRLASFGEIGPELSGAIDGHREHRATLIDKLCHANPNISEPDAAVMLNALRGNVTHPDEYALRDRVLAALQDTIVGSHPDTAIELLLFWVFEASERRRDLTRPMVLLQLGRIGEYLAALRDTTSEWMVSIRPVQATPLGSDERERLLSEYRQGVQATWSHILADADSPRTDRLQEIHRCIQSHSVVIIRGASGQGKSSLGWRYLRDYYTDGLRFHVRMVTGREHAVRIANAIRGHVQSLRLQTLIYLDLSPADSDWIQLVRELSEAGVKVLVTIREEDFRRAGLAVGDIDASEISLDRVSRDEAERIFIGLTSERADTLTLDFEEAWTRFSAKDGGPLLEFTYLVTQGETLASKLKSQILRIQDEAASNRGPVTSAHLRLLAIAAVANAAECRVFFDELCANVGLDPLTRPLAYFENEYLIRVGQDHGRPHLAPLHPLRSDAMLAALLHDAPDRWLALAVECLQHILPEDVERFLLFAFSRRPQYAEAIETALRNQPLRSWTHASGVCRALLWEGVNRYEVENRDVITAAIKQYDSGWWFVCDSFIATGQEGSDQLRKALADILPEVPRVELTAKATVFGPFENWATNVAQPMSPLSAPHDWTGAGYVAFWIGHRSIKGALRTSLEALLPDSFPAEVGINEIAAFISGRHALGDCAFPGWHGRQLNEIKTRFIRETQSMYLNDDGKEIKVFFPVILKDITESAHDKDDWHGQALQKIHLLRQLFPEREKYCSQGLGLEVLGQLIPYDETIKNVPVENLHDARAVELNALFGNLVQYRHQRAASWRIYADAVFAFRDAVCSGFRQLRRAWEQMLEQRHVQPRTVRQIPGAELDQIQRLSKLPMLPRTAVDEWGFVSEGREQLHGISGRVIPLWNSLQRFKPWGKAFTDFEIGVTQVTNRAIGVTITHVASKKTGEGQPDDGNGHLLLINLQNSWTGLSLLQREFRRVFGHLCDDGRLRELERHEQSTFRHLWSVSFPFIREPMRCIEGGSALLERSVEQREKQFLDEIGRHVSDALEPNAAVRVGSDPHFIEGVPCLVVISDHSVLSSLNDAKPAVVQAIWRAAQAGGWRRLEWVPLVVRWQNILVVHTFRGRALLPAGVKLSSLVLFSREEFQATPHDVIDLPIPRGDFDAMEIPIWELPLIRSAAAWQGDLMAFALTAIRFYPMLEIVVEHAIPEDSLRDSLATFSAELTMLRNTARERCEDLVTLLKPLLGNAELGDRASGWIAIVLRVSDDVLFCLAPSGSTTIDPNVFTRWLKEIAGNLTRITEILNELITHAVARHA